MKSVHATLFVAICATFTFAQQKTDLQNQGLSGKVKSASISSLSSDGKTQRLIETIHFNTKGMITDRSLNDDKGRLVGITAYSYDASRRLSKTRMVDQQGKSIDEQITTYDDAKHQKIIHATGEDASDVSTDIYKLDPTGNTVEIQHSDGKKSIGTTRFKMTDTAVEMTFTGADGKPASATVGPCLGAAKVVLKKDASGTLLEQSAYDIKGVLKNKRSYVYDAKMHATSMLVESPQSKVKYEYAYEFDPNGNWIKQSIQTTVVSGPKEVMNHSANGGAKHAMLRKFEYY